MEIEGESTEKVRKSESREVIVRKSERPKVRKKIQVGELGSRVVGKEE